METQSLAEHLLSMPRSNNMRENAIEKLFKFCLNNKVLQNVQFRPLLLSSTLLFLGTITILLQLLFLLNQFSVLDLNILICGALRDLVPFVQF